jgi:DNA-binding transcriptional ArsR family regulator
MRGPSPYSTRAFERAAAMFRGAGDIPRLRILERLLTGEMFVSDLAASVGEPVATVSQRLRLLKMSGLIASRRAGRRKYYRLADDHVSRMVLNVLAHATEQDVRRHR